MSTTLTGRSVILASRLSHASPTAAFDRTFSWTIGFTLAGIILALLAESLGYARLCDDA